MKQLYLLPLLLMISFCSARAQSVIHIQPGANLFIQPQASVNLDGLMIVPSGNMLLNNVSMERTTTLLQPVANKHIQRVYRFSNTVPAFSGMIRFYYQDSELNQIPKTALTLNINNGSGWQDFRTNIIRDASNNFVETNITASLSLRELTLTAVQAVLPLKWGQVNGSCNNNTVTVRWETLQEINTKYFMVERSSNGVDWLTVQIKEAAGNSASPATYSIDDTSSINTPLWFYRIRSVDLDGSYSYSKTISVKSCPAINSLKLFPVPAKTTVQISFNSDKNQKSILHIFNTQGQLYKMQDLSLQQGNNQFNIDISSYPAGNYYIRLFVPNEQPLSAKFIKQ